MHVCVCATRMRIQGFYRKTKKRRWDFVIKSKIVSLVLLLIKAKTKQKPKTIYLLEKINTKVLKHFYMQ